MDQLQIEGLLKDLNTRTTRIEQKLPTLATTTDVREEAERTRQHVDKEAERTRQHFDVGRDIRSVLDNHERRITTLEANTPKRR